MVLYSLMVHYGCGVTTVCFYNDLIIIDYQLGDGSAVSRSAPARVLLTEPVKTVFLGASHTVALT
jgi:hypothetical protein